MEADFGMTQQAMDEQNRHKGDENLYVRFFLAPLQNKEKTLEEGRPIFEDKEFISIMVPGDKDNIVRREVRMGDAQRFPKHWAAFKNDQEEILEGTPLDQWPQITASQVQELKHFHIRTVEQLAEVNDSTAQQFMGINLLKGKAKEYLEASKEGAPVAMLQGELAKRDETIAGMETSIDEMRKELTALKKKAKK